MDSKVECNIIIILFLSFCIMILGLLVYLVKIASIKYLEWVGYIVLIIVIGNIYKYFSESEVCYDKICWDNLQWINIIYLIFVYNAINKNRNSWIYLLLGLIVNTIGYVLIHYVNGNIEIIWYHIKNGSFC